eukprot:1143329-Pelagomonas_calceolata.AAC.1
MANTQRHVGPTTQPTAPARAPWLYRSAQPTPGRRLLCHCVMVLGVLQSALAATDETSED